MGIRMSGTPICAITLPSLNSTIEWTTDWGWITTSIREGGRPNSHVASITSSPLFMRVAESTEIFAPIRHVGCPSACATVADRIRATVWVRNGPPEAVRRIRRISSRRRPAIAWKTAECSLSTGRISRLPAPRGGGHELPGHHEKLLVRQGDPLPLFRGGDDRTDGGDPGRRGEDDVDVPRARRLPHPLFPEEEARPPGKLLPEILPVPLGEADDVGAEATGEAGQRPGVRPGAQRGRAKPAGEPGDDVQRVPADGAGRAQNRYPLAAHAPTPAWDDSAAKR